jgi:predicted dehydrogenase
MSSQKVNIAIAGLGFGAEFIPIYQKHPNANLYAVCQRSESKLKAVGDAFKIEKRYSDFYKMIDDPKIDAVHINTPIHEHARMSVAALKAGKHVSCTVPMATSVDECWQIIEAVKSSGKKYMMAETVIYSREYLYVKELRDTGKLGRIQFLRAAHQQDMMGWPGYWEGLPPMHYATHVVSPCLALAGKQAEYVSCFGSGHIQAELITKYGAPYAIESCHIKLKDSDICAEVTRSLFNTARQYIESFDCYGSKMSFEWQLMSNEEPVVHLGGEEARHVPVPDYAHLLPAAIQQFTTQCVYDMAENAHLSFIQGSGHGGSHPHLANEFLVSILEDRDPFPNVFQSANWTSVGILAHESAMRGGQIICLPDYK